MRDIVYQVLSTRDKNNFCSTFLLTLKKSFYSLSVTLQPNSGLDSLIVKDAIAHTRTHAQDTSDQPVAEATNFTTPNKHKKRKSIPSERTQCASVRKSKQMIQRKI
jgi:hypothetical protein